MRKCNIFLNVLVKRIFVPGNAPEVFLRCLGPLPSNSALILNKCGPILDKNHLQIEILERYITFPYRLFGYSGPYAVVISQIANA